MKDLFNPPAAVIEAEASLTDLAKQISAAHGEALAAARTSLEHARKAGQLLLRVKERLPHGKFMSWVEASCPFKRSTAGNYMRIAKDWQSLQLAEGEPTTIAGALQQLAEPPRENYQPAGNLEEELDGVAARIKAGEARIAEGAREMSEDLEAIRSGLTPEQWDAWCRSNRLSTGTAAAFIEAGRAERPADAYLAAWGGMVAERYNWPVHAGLAIFPEFTGPEYELFRESIAKHGQILPIAVWQGWLVDGRARLRACRELGLIPKVRELPPDTDPVAYAESVNLCRTHLSCARVGRDLAKLRRAIRGEG